MAHLLGNNRLLAVVAGGVFFVVAEALMQRVRDVGVERTADAAVAGVAAPREWGAMQRRGLSEVDGIIRTKMARTSPVTKTEELQQRPIEGLFEALHLGNAPDRECYLQFDRFSDGTDAAQDRRTETLRVVLRDGTIPLPGLNGFMTATFMTATHGMGRSKALGTLIACARPDIVTGMHSSLGPVDPQIAGLAPHGVIEEFTAAQKEAARNQILGAPRQPILAKYHPNMDRRVPKAINWAGAMVTA
jgi:hypothetical protein